MSARCLLCHQENAELYHRDKLRPYFRCTNCSLVFVPESYHLSPEEEKERYDFHENDPDDPHYRNFLEQCFDPLIKRLPDESHGLDFGSGPGPTLHLMFEEAGHTMKIFDLFYANNPEVFENHYDFITATEVVEHLHQPMQELDRLWNCLKPDGCLGLMTKLVRSKAAFKNWHYIRDDTHVAFFSKATFEWITDRWQAQSDFIDDNVIIIYK